MIETTAILVIKGAPSYIDQSLSSFEKHVQEIIVGTIDTPESLINKLKKNKKIRIIPLESSTPFADMVKEKLKKLAKGKYILYIDPDELFPTKSFQLIKENLNKFDYFFIPRKNIIFGKWIQHSRWWPDYQLRFFKKDNVIWPETIHPVPQTKGNGFELPANEEFAITHFNYDNLTQYFEKSIRYARSEAKKAVIDNSPVTLSLTFKKSLNEFISRYFAEDGYKDGSHGFVLAILQMFYYIIVHAFYWEEKKYNEVDSITATKEVQRFYSNSLRETNFWINKKKLLTGADRLKIKIVSKVLDIFKI